MGLFSFDLFFIKHIHAYTKYSLVIFKGKQTNLYV